MSQQEKRGKEMENNDKQGELFESGLEDSELNIGKWQFRLVKARALKQETDNALRKGTLVYAKEAEAGFRRMLNAIYSTLQVILSETLPQELVAIRTTGEIRDRLVGTYNEILEKGSIALEAELKKEQEPVNDSEEDNGEPVA